MLYLITFRWWKKRCQTHKSGSGKYCLLLLKDYKSGQPADPVRCNEKNCPVLKKLEAAEHL